MLHSTKTTHSYKSAGEKSVQLDLYLPDETKFGLIASTSRQIMARAVGKPVGGSDHRLPVLVYFNGVDPVPGNWSNIPLWLLNDALNAGFAVVSADHRLLDLATDQDILEDLQDVFKWIQEDLNEIMTGASSQIANLDRIALAGSSRGSYLAHLAHLAMHVEPKPRVLAGIYTSAGDGTRGPSEENHSLDRTPPSILVHRTADGVGIEECGALMSKLRAQGTPAELVQVEGTVGADVKESSSVAGLDRVVPFLLEHLQ